MNRRNFFKTVGIPALALPFVKVLGLKKSQKQIPWIYYACEQMAVMTPFSHITITCPHCQKSRLKIPVLWSKYWHWDMNRISIIPKHQCNGCKKFYSIEIRYGQKENMFLIRTGPPVKPESKFSLLDSD